MDEILIDVGNGEYVMVTAEEDVQGVGHLNIARTTKDGDLLDEAQIYQEDFDTLRALMEMVDDIEDRRGGYE